MTALSRSTVILSLLIALVAANSASSGEWYEGGFLKITQILVHDDSLEVMLEGNVRDERIFRLYSSEPNYQVKANTV